MSQPQFKVTAPCGTEKEFDNRQDAEDGLSTHEGLCPDCSPGSCEIEPVNGKPDVVEPADEDANPTPEPVEDVPETTESMGDGLEELGQELGTDPLDVLPNYMITTVDGKPSLNKRGVSVLAYHYGITVTDKDTVAYPHETEFETAVVEMTVESEDGRVFVGAGEAHVDETPKHQLLRMAETRAYKRAVIFATGTGIVGYQELMEELQ